jgi:hypothetical protein
MKQNDIKWSFFKYIFFEKKFDYNKIIMSTQNNIIIITGSAKQHKAHI